VHTGHRERLKNQYFQNGINSMTDIQQLELLLFYAIPQKDTNPIAHALLEKFGNIKNVLNASVRDLCTVDGIKESSATFLKLVSHMTNVCSQPKERELINSTKLAKEYCEKFYVGVSFEQFHVVCLSKDNKVIGTKMIKSGTTDEIKVEIRDITEFAISINCNRIIVSHNHPEGNGEMSDEDFRYTYSLVCSCMLNDIDILDHIIVGIDKNYSMAEHGILEKLKDKAFSKVLIPKERQILLSNISKKYQISEHFETNISTDNL
jgi:DNA repair protein RadC